MARITPCVGALLALATGALAQDWEARISLATSPTSRWPVGTRLQDVVARSGAWLATARTRGDGADARVELRRETAPGVWTLVATLRATDPGVGLDDDDGFGHALALAGDRLAVGAPGDDALGSDAGAVLVFAWDGATWSLETVLRGRAPAAGARLGERVAFDGTRVLAASNVANGGADGDVVLTSFLGGALGWVEEASWTRDALVPGVDDDRVVRDLALDGDRFVAGCWDDDGVRRPNAVIWHRHLGAWAFEATVRPASSHHDTVRFGESVALRDDGLVVGDPLGRAALLVPEGLAEVHRRGPTGWAREEVLVDARGSEFVFSTDGLDVAWLGDDVLVSAPGRYRVLRWTRAGGPWRVARTYLAPNGTIGGRTQNLAHDGARLFLAQLQEVAVVPFDTVAALESFCLHDGNDVTRLGVSGSASISRGDLTFELRASGTLSDHVLALGGSVMALPSGGGQVCIGRPIHRIALVPSDSGPPYRVRFDVAAGPLAVVAGSTLWFQARSLGPLRSWTNGIAATFSP